MYLIISKSYIFQHLKSDFRSCAKFRCGVAPLQIELDRYIGQPENNRLCPMCQNDVESEQGFDLRFNNMCSFDKFCFLMSHEQLQVDSAKACQKILLRRQHMLYI